MTSSRDLIVIGGAEGGLEALVQLARALPAELPAAVVVVLRGGVMHAADPVQTLRSARPQFTVSEAKDGETIRAGHVYLSPPDRHLVVAAPGALLLDGGQPILGYRPAIDRLFKSAASVYGPRVIGVLLTGDDHDGTEGLDAIEEADGIGIVQDPDEAVAPDLPATALTQDHPHYIARLADMATLLTTLVGSPGTPDARFRPAQS